MVSKYSKQTKSKNLLKCTLKMKKYKLIKEYPGSPKLGTVVKQNPTNNCNHYTHLRVLLSDDNIHKEIIENNTEFWEEVVEKDYEILYYQSKDKKIAPTTNFATEISKPGYWNIHSVKRLSDGEVFTIGDKVKKPFYKNPFKINHIYIAIDMVWLHSRPFVEGTYTHTLYESTPLCEAIKYKKPLFTTEDGVDIFKDDVCFRISNNFTIINPKGEKFISKPSDEYKYFSTKEATKEYILMNKPCLSINDLEDLNINCTGNLSFTRTDVKQLVKSRL